MVPIFAGTQIIRRMDQLRQHRGRETPGRIKKWKLIVPEGKILPGCREGKSLHFVKKALIG
jgi:hypothetical protein